MSDSQSVVFQEVEEPQTAHAVQRPAAPVGVHPTTKPPLQPSSSPRGVAAQPLVAIKPKKKIITTTPSVHSEDSIQFIAVPSRTGSKPATPKQAAEASPPPRITTASQKPRVAPRSRGDSVHSIGSSIQFNMEDSNLSPGPGRSPSAAFPHRGSTGDAESHYYNSHGALPSKPPLVQSSQHRGRKLSTHSLDPEESIAFQDVAESSHSSSHGRATPGIPNDSIAFQMLDDDGLPGGPGQSQSFPRIFKPLNTVAHHDVSPDQSLAFEEEDGGATWNRGPSPRAHVGGARSPSPQFLNNDSIAFQIEDSLPRSVARHEEVKAATVPLHARSTATPSAVPVAALSPDSDGQDNQSVIFQFENSAYSEPENSSSPPPFRSPRNDDGPSADNRDQPRPKTKKTVVSNRLQKLSRGSSPARQPGRGDATSPQVTPSNGEDGTDERRRSSRGKQSSLTDGSAPPPGDVDMPKKKRRHSSKSTDKPRSSSTEESKRRRRRHTRHTDDVEAQKPESVTRPLEDVPEKPQKKGTSRHKSHKHHKTREPTPTQSEAHTDTDSTSSTESTATTKTETDLQAAEPLRQETSAFHSRNNSSTIVVHHLREQEAMNDFHGNAQQQQRGQLVTSGSDVSRSLLQDDAYQRHSQQPPPQQMSHLHARNETAVYHGGNSGLFPPPANRQRGASGGFSVPPEDLARASQEAAYWNNFNTTQRHELQQLQQRIRAARRQDKTLLERSLEAFEHTNTAPQAGGYAAATGSQTMFRWKHGNPHAKVSTAAQGTAGLSSPIPRPATAGKPPQHQGNAAAAATPRSGRDARRRSPPACAGGKESAREQDAAETASAQATVAHMLGVLWPPARPNELFFLSGTRLTPLQIQRFYETAEVQKQTASATSATPEENAPGRGRSASRAHARDAQRLRQAYMSPTQLRRSASPDGCVSSRGGSESSSPLPIRATNRKTIKRSQVLRDVFNAMDVAKKGLLYATELGALHYLLEHELAALEADIGGGSGAGIDAVPLASQAPTSKGQAGSGLMASSLHQRELYENAWQGLTREVAVLDAASTAASSHSFASTRAELAQQATLQRRALRLSLAVNVVIPLCRTSGIGALDFPTVSLLVFAALDHAATQASPQGRAWRDIVSQYFVMLS